MPALCSKLRLVALAALLGTALTSHAAFTTYSSQSSFLNAVGGVAVDTFDDLTATAYVGPLLRSAGPYTYQAASTSGLFGAGTAGNAGLSNMDHAEQIVLTSFSPTVLAVGGFFFASDVDGASLPARQVTVTVIDSAHAVSTTVLSSATAGGFFGVRSSSPIVTLALYTDPGLEAWPTVDNLTLAVPEPGPPALLLAGLGVLAWLRRSRTTP